MKSLRSQSGVTLVLSLLILAVISAVAVSLSVLLFREIAATRAISFSIKSFYAAETGIEQGLWIVRDVRRSGGDISEAVAALTSPDNGTLEDTRAVWTRTATDISEIITINLKQDESAFFDLYNSDSPILPPRFITLGYNECAGPTLIEATWTGWDPGSGFLGYSRKNFPVPCDGSIIPLEVDPGDTPTRFRLQLRAFDGAATNLTLEVLDETQTPILIPSEVQVKSVGVFPDGSGLAANQAIQANVPWLLPISGIFSYVLFSEENIEK
ncbi:MAG: pilus assembly PilX N-terminal domain-containing protein [bacterium]|nr:pilus assembly PilX N-terminal domain-containing protein [bacterium]